MANSAILCLNEENNLVIIITTRMILTFVLALYLFSLFFISVIFLLLKILGVLSIIFFV